jgi:hypothetical protein
LVIARERVSAGRQASRVKRRRSPDLVDPELLLLALPPEAKYDVVGARFFLLFFVVQLHRRRLRCWQVIVRR